MDNILNGSFTVGTRTFTMKAIKVADELYEINYQDPNDASGSCVLQFPYVDDPTVDPLYFVLEALQAVDAVLAPTNS